MTKTLFLRLFLERMKAEEREREEKARRHEREIALQEKAAQQSQKRIKIMKELATAIIQKSATEK